MAKKRRKRGKLALWKGKLIEKSLLVGRDLTMGRTACKGGVHLHGKDRLRLRASKTARRALREALSEGS